jgi:hypothetical protein
MKFWDVSAIVPLCLDEPWTPLLTQVLAEDALMLVWWGSLVECWSAFARLRREGIFQAHDEEQARTLLAHFATAWTRLVRRTICFSKTTTMHDLVLGLFINRYEFGRCI